MFWHVFFWHVGVSPLERVELEITREKKVGAYKGGYKISTALVGLQIK